MRLIDVAEAARRTGRDPETIRRWIRSGKLRAQKIGLKHMIEESDLPQPEDDDFWGVPDSMRTLPDGRPMPNFVAIIRAARDSR